MKLLDCDQYDQGRRGEGGAVIQLCWFLVDKNFLYTSVVCDEEGEEGAVVMFPCSELDSFFFADVEFGSEVLLVNPSESESARAEERRTRALFSLVRSLRTTALPVMIDKLRVFPSEL